MAKKSYRSIHFDLKTKEVEKIFGNRTKAYYILGKELQKHGFEHRQYSGYVSKKQMTDTEIYDMIIDISSRNPWLAQCARRFDTEYVSKKQHSMLTALQAATISAEERMQEDPIYRMRIRKERRQIDEELSKLDSPLVKEQELQKNIDTNTHD